MKRRRRRGGFRGIFRNFCWMDPGACLNIMSLRLNLIRLEVKLKSIWFAGDPIVIITLNNIFVQDVNKQLYINLSLVQKNNGKLLTKME